ncbi:hypothetical protein LX36DRAFT_698298 [Colletotrichum falcatum]|nr:hypothetical protein LX36DRAFT_698298 [Colletotrichum falcatum]
MAQTLRRIHTHESLQTSAIVKDSAKLGAAGAEIPTAKSQPSRLEELGSVNYSRRSMKRRFTFQPRRIAMMHRMGRIGIEPARLSKKIQFSGETVERPGACGYAQDPSENGLSEAEKIHQLRLLDGTSVMEAYSLQDPYREGSEGPAPSDWAINQLESPTGKMPHQRDDQNDPTLHELP